MFYLSEESLPHPWKFNSKWVVPIWALSNKVMTMWTAMTKFAQAQIMSIVSQLAGSLYETLPAARNISPTDTLKWEMGIFISYYYFHYFHSHRWEKWETENLSNFWNKERTKEDKDIMEHFLQILQLVDKQIKELKHLIHFSITPSTLSQNVNILFQGQVLHLLAGYTECMTQNLNLVRAYH